MLIAPKVITRMIIGMIIFEGTSDVEECLRFVRVELARLNVHTCMSEHSHLPRNVALASERIASGEPGV